MPFAPDSARISGRLLALLAVVTLGFVIFIFSWHRPQPAPLLRPVVAAGHGEFGPVMLWIGDAYTAGEGATGPQSAESCLTAKSLGYVCRVDAEPGTGFVATGRTIESTFGPIRQRLRADVHLRPAPKVVVVDAGRSDLSLPAARVDPAITSTLTAIRRDWPAATLVVIAPYYLDGTRSHVFDEYEKAETAAVRGVFINPVSEGWIHAGGKHGRHGKGHHRHRLNAAGQRFIARHLTADFQTLGI